jgi:hypothetical protein
VYADDEGKLLEAMLGGMVKEDEGRGQNTVYMQESFEELRRGGVVSLPNLTAGSCVCYGLPVVLRKVGKKNE